MDSFLILIDFLGCQYGPIEIEQDKYSLVCLCNEAMILACGRRICVDERFEVAARIPWMNNYSTLISSDTELLELFTKFRERGLDEIHFDATLLPLQVEHPDELLSANSAPRPTQPDNEPNPTQTQFSQPNTNILSGSYTPIIDPDLFVASESDSDSDGGIESCTFPAHVPLHETSSSKTISKSLSISIPCVNSIPSQTENSDSEFDPDAQFAWSEDEIEDDALYDAVVENSESMDEDVEVDSEVSERYQSNDSDGAIGTDSDDEGPVAKMSRQLKGKLCGPNGEGQIKLEKGMVFESIHHYRNVLREFAIERGFELIRMKNERTRVTVGCKQPGCPWRAHASLLPDDITFKLKTYNPKHTCTRKRRNTCVTATWIAKKLGDDFRSNPNMDIKTIDSKLRTLCGVKCRKQKLWRAKRIALHKMSGDHEGCYNKLYKYANCLRLFNPGTMSVVSCTRTVPTDNPNFQRFFVSFPAQRDGFVNGCRPFIGLDGCHLRGPFGGVLLSAVALDANSELFPLAVGICEGENLDSWGWFLGLLHEYVGVQERRLITFMSDRQKGILAALSIHFPNSKTRFCARHIFANFKSKFPGVQVRSLFWGAARATDPREFGYKMEQIKGISVEAYEWLQKIPACHWSRHGFDESVKNDHVTNNMTESFNSQLNMERGEPVLTLLEQIRRKIMKKIAKRKQRANNLTTSAPPTVMGKIEAIQKEGRHLKVIWAAETEFEVIDETQVFVIDLGKSNCQCGAWQITGIPCKHAMACIMYKRGNPTDYVDSMLKKTAWMQTYNTAIHPIPDETLWPEIEVDKVLPPEKRRLPGRPKVARRREPTEPAKQPRSFTLKCAICKGLGHNKRTCPKKPRTIEQGSGDAGPSTQPGPSQQL